MSVVEVYKRAFNQGSTASSNGWERDSCPYRGVVAAVYWLAGFDGYTWEQAKACHEEAKASKKSIKAHLGFSRIGLNNI